MKARLETRLTIAFFCFMQLSCNTTPPPVTGTVQVFLMDNLNTSYDHVWGTILKVDFVKTDLTTVTAFDQTSTGGAQVDLLSLRDSQGYKFRLLSGLGALAGDYIGINITMANAVNIYPTSALPVIGATFSGAIGNTFVLSLTFPAQTLGTTVDFVVDFDLASWVLNGGIVSTVAPSGTFIKLGTKTSLSDATRHVESHHDGAVASLAGVIPNQTFTLTDGLESIAVATDSSTTIINSDGSTSPLLANGQQVEVRGKFDTTNHAFVSTEIVINKNNEPQGQKLIGLVTAFDAISHTMTVTLKDVEGFLPESSSIDITVDPNTVYFNLPGISDTQDQFFAALEADTTVISARGLLTGSILAVTRLRIVREGSHQSELDGNAVIGGTTSNIQTTGQLTFDIAVTVSEGQRFDISKAVHVVTTSSTTFQIGGQTATQNSLLAALNSSTVVKVRGTLDTSTMTLTAIAISI